MEFLTGNPFCTPVGLRIEHATSLQTEDWGINMEICDIICETEDGPKDAVRAIKKRIVGNKNFKEVMLALTVLEACVKNCGYRFHVLVSSRDFVEGVLVRTILPRNDPPLVVYERILTIIQAWADAFRSSPDLTGVVCVYEDLRRKGIKFPVPDMCSPIHTPNKRFFSGSESEAHVSPTHHAHIQEQTPPWQNTEGPITLSPDQVKRLTSDLENVHSNLKVMSEIMSQMDSGSSQRSNTSLLKQLYGTCKEMQDRVVHLIPKVTDEKLVDQLLVVNDDINTTFTRYHSFEKRLKRQSAEQPSDNLIDLKTPCKPQSQSQLETPVACEPISQTVSSLSSHMSRLSTKEKDEIQSKTSSKNLQDGQERSVLDELVAGSSDMHNAGGDDCPQVQVLGSSPQFNWMLEKGMIPVNQSEVMENIEQWLDVDEDDDLADEGVTSEEFDRFLAGRAKAAERLPSVKHPSDDHTPSQP
ncbi:target of Myb1 membrane trafficking protein isoform 2-T2 [Clarias gariepinus]|uniref:target of Myb protein 1 isoform X2 n=1 Tax=Clarias gariepinus TaxID=13013 RepID=UPI00234DE59B|nr:target of Myb protein 1 isoform X2 [Clarias gariepinus]